MNVPRLPRKAVKHRGSVEKEATEMLEVGLALRVLTGNCSRAGWGKQDSAPRHVAAQHGRSSWGDTHRVPPTRGADGGHAAAGRIKGLRNGPKRCRESRESI